MSLMDQYKVEAMINDQTVTGTWSPVYSQALSVSLDNGMRFVSNFRYNLPGNTVPHIEF